MAADEIPLPEFYVQPGELRLVREPAILRTVLGSCVGITFLVPRLGIGALCHPMLPKCPSNPPGGAAAGRRYVDFAVRDVACQLDSIGIRRGEVTVKLFGGGDVLVVNNEMTRPTVGQLNCEAATQILDEQGFVVAASSLGGNSGLNILFNTGTGEVRLKRLG